MPTRTVRVDPREYVLSGHSIHAAPFWLMQRLQEAGVPFRQPEEPWNLLGWPTIDGDCEWYDDPVTGERVITVYLPDTQGEP